MLRISKNR